MKIPCKGLVNGIPKMAGSTSQQVKSSARVPSKNSRLESCVVTANRGWLTIIPLVVNGEQDVTRISAAEY